MAKTVKVDQLADEITKAMREYTEDVTEGINNKVDDVADKVLQEVKATAPMQTGEYEAGFVKVNKSFPGKRRYVVWNKRYYSLVHLLEFGHVLRSGGRTRAFPHMGPAHDKYVKVLPDEIKTIVKNGGSR